MPRHIRKGDSVIVTAGNARGSTGTVLQVIDGQSPNDTRVIVQGVNLRTKHLKPTQQRPQGAIVKREAAIHISNVSPVVGGKPTRVRFQVKPDGSKVRVAVRGGGELHTLRTASSRGGAASSK
jgi:large subunit ribosomal protein L24